MTRRILGVLSGSLLCAGAAFAGVGDFLGDLVDPHAAFAGFLGAWSDRGTAHSDIDRVVVTDGGSGRARIQVFGRCETAACNWGVQTARVRTDGAQSAVVRSITADFNLGYALRHVTLRKGVQGTLEYDVVTEFTDGSDRHDYETLGRLLPPGPVVQSAVPAAPLAAPPPSPAAATPAMVPSPSAAMVAMPQEDCVSLNVDHAYVARDDSGWQVRDFLHPVLRTGPDRTAALAAMKVISAYHFDEVCYAGHGARQMTYWRSAGAIARTSLPQQDCVDVHSAKVQAVRREDGWMVVDGDREIYSYGDDEAAADQAAGIIRSYGLNRQCFFARPQTNAHYWLAL